MSSTRKFGRPRIQRREVTFKAVDSFGRSHQIEVYVEMLAGGEDGAQNLVTADGESVQRIDKGHYRIGLGRVDLTSTDPSAP